MTVVLIVEDNAMNTKLVRDVLQYKGYETLEATTGREGVRMCIEHLPDLVLMDIQLPDIDGMTAFEEIRAHPRTRNIPVLVVTASVMPQDQRRIAASGFDAFISKPIDVKAFVETVGRFVTARKESPQ
ncbi:MAG: response regulator [Ramlibacter sp.]|nr:response regulator [Ramlibacter sp.]